MDKKTSEILYYIAEDFCRLSYLQKFNIGMEMLIIRPDELELTEENLEEKIFVGMYRKNKLEKFVNLVYKVMHE